MVSTSTLDHDDKAFAFFKLPREVRDAIYGQPEMMDLIPLPQEIEYQEVRAEITAVKLRESLLLISRQFNTEYREICEPQVGVRVSSAVGDVASTWSMVVPQEVAGKTRALHLHAGRWSAWVTMNQIVYWEGLYARLTDWSSQMPKLRAITVSLYKDVVHLRQKDVKVISDGIAKLLTVEKLHRFQLVVMDRSDQWPVRDHPGKKLFVQWRSGDALPPAFKFPPTKYVESCCDHIFNKSLIGWDDIEEARRQEIEESELYMSGHGDDFSDGRSDNVEEEEEDDDPDYDPVASFIMKMNGTGHSTCWSAIQKFRNECQDNHVEDDLHDSHEPDGQSEDIGNDRELALHQTMAQGTDEDANYPGSERAHLNGSLTPTADDTHAS
jgi:hypothetical protein